MHSVNAMILCDFYKVSHREQYPDNAEIVYSTWTPRESRIDGVEKIVNFGQQAFIKEYLIDFFRDNFFSRPKQDVVNEYARYIKHTLGTGLPHTKHIEDLHDIGYLPLEIKSLPEGMLVPTRVPMFTIQNTDPRFFWLTNYIETLASCELWQSATSATIAFQYRKILTRFAKETGADTGFVDFQGHDFSMRGMGGLHSAMISGLGHLVSFVGTDTIPATEHSVMCANGQSEKEVFTRLLTKVYPSGFISIVSDTWDFWNIVGTILPSIKELVLARDGKLVIRPDSGDPIKIICGDSTASNPFAKKGLVQCLWEIFGGTTNAAGFKNLDSHIGAIYGDSITLDRCEKICQGLKHKGFASTNVVFGIGSYTYQYNTRDTFGFALKSTACVVAGTEYQLYKNPKTDSGVKKSQKGRIAVLAKNGTLVCQEELSLKDNVASDLLVTIFKNGHLMVDDSLSEIRKRLRKYIE